MAGFQNHYKTLDLPHFADEAAIKAAYRTLVKLHHPDANGGDDSRFKEINHAYSILSDAHTKAAFDAKLKPIIERAETINPHKKNGSNGKKTAKQPNTSTPKQQAKQQQAQHNTQSQAPSSDVVDRFFHRFLKEPLRQHAPKNWPGSINSWFGGESNPKDNDSKAPRTASGSSSPIRGEDVSVETTLPLQQAARGTSKTVHVKHKEPCPACLTSGLVNDKRCSPCLGEGYTIRKRSINVKIPAGVQHGAKIRVSGEGGRSPNGGPSGDLYLLVQLSPPPTTNTSASPPPKKEAPKKPEPPPEPKPEPPPPPKKEPLKQNKPKPEPPPEKNSKKSTEPASSSTVDKELDTHSDYAMSCWDMLLGAEVTVATHQGKALLTIPPRTPPGQTICIPHMGKRYGHHKGDHWVTLSITLPHSLTEEQQALIRLWQRR